MTDPATFRLGINVAKSREKNTAEYLTEEANKAIEQLCQESVTLVISTCDKGRMMLVFTIEGGDDIATVKGMIRDHFKYLKRRGIQ